MAASLSLYLPLVLPGFNCPDAVIFFSSLDSVFFHVPPSFHSDLLSANCGAWCRSEVKHKPKFSGCENSVIKPPSSQRAADKQPQVITTSVSRRIQLSKACTQQGIQYYLRDRRQAAASAVLERGDRGDDHDRKFRVLGRLRRLLRGGFRCDRCHCGGHDEVREALRSKCEGFGSFCVERERGAEKELWLEVVIDGGWNAQGADAQHSHDRGVDTSPAAHCLLCLSLAQLSQPFQPVF